MAPAGHFSELGTHHPFCCPGSLQSSLSSRSNHRQGGWWMHIYFRSSRQPWDAQSRDAETQALKEGMHCTRPQWGVMGLELVGTQGFCPSSAGLTSCPRWWWRIAINPNGGLNKPSGSSWQASRSCPLLSTTPIAYVANWLSASVCPALWWVLPLRGLYCSCDNPGRGHTIIITLGDRGVGGGRDLPEFP